MSLRIRSIEHAAKARSPGDYPRIKLPEAAFAGRSNVGKSSAINTLLGRHRLARVSGTPGRTRRLDFYRVELASHAPRAFYLVDFPGYGYAKLPRNVRDAWKRMIEEYLSASESLKVLVHILDIRRTPDDRERMLVNWLRHYSVPGIWIATKADKVSRSKRAVAVQEIARHLELTEAERPVIFSAKDGTGKAEVWGRLREHLRSEGPRPRREE